MTRVVAATHPSETDLLNLATGREPGEATAAARKHVDDGCRRCVLRLRDLGRLVETGKKENAFDSLLESDLLPELRRPTMGRTLPFVKARVSVDDVYRLSQTAEKPSELILHAARAGPDELAAALRSLDGKAYRGFALLYAAQKADRLVAEDPNKALALARLIFEEAATLPLSNPNERIASPTPRQAVQAEAALLESSALLQKGDADSARKVVGPARKLFRESGDLGFGVALCDFYEGTAAIFEKDYSEAQSLLERSLAVFAEFGQEHLAACARAGLGTLFVQKGQFERALEYFDASLRAFEYESETESQRTTMLLNNRATALMRLGRFDEARATFAKALNFGRRNNLASHLFFIRTGLAELDFRRGEYRRALRAFTGIAREASPLASKAELLFSRLYAAECQARIGSYGPMAIEIEALRRERQEHPFAPSPALGELFMSLDQGTIDADLIAHVREYLQDEENGVKRAYRPLRLVG
jgi:tetratricopeptide (TPR) repeat protein